MPNPTTDWVNVHAANAPQHMALYDAKGTLLAQYEAGTAQIDMRGYSQGIYYVGVVTKEKSSYIKIVKK